MILPAAASLALFVWLLSLHPAFSGGVYAAYGGVYVAMALGWLHWVDGMELSVSDWIGAGVALLGMMIIVLGWRQWRFMEASMGEEVENRSVEFFESQFRRQIQGQDWAPNPFETRALDYLVGTVLDLGSGLGNLSLEAGRRGHSVLAVDSSPSAVAHINAQAMQECIPVRAIAARLEEWRIAHSYDTIVAIGLLMFFPRERALELLHDIQDQVRPGGRAIVNVLIEGTTFMDMFQPGHCYLFGRNELEERFGGWGILSSQHEAFPAPGETRKEFSTVIALKPNAA